MCPKWPPGGVGCRVSINVFITHGLKYLWPKRQSFIQKCTFLALRALTSKSSHNLLVICRLLSVSLGVVCLFVCLFVCFVLFVFVFFCLFFCVCCVLFWVVLGWFFRVCVYVFGFFVCL